MNDELRAKLWELVYGLLDEAEAESLRARISSDRDVAREYARVKLKSELIARAARASCEAGELPNLIGDANQVSPERRAVLVGRAVTSVATGIVALTLLFMMGSTYFRQESPLLSSTAEKAKSRLLSTYPRMLVTGPPTIVRNRSATYEVLLQRLDETLLPLPVSASLNDQNGNVVWQETTATNAQGTCPLKIPAQDFQEDALQLAIVADPSSPLSEEGQLTTWLAVGDPTTPHYVAVDEAFDYENGVALVRTVDLSTTSSQKGDGPALAAGYADKITSAPDVEAGQLAQEMARVRWGMRSLNGAEQEESGSLAMGVLQPLQTKRLSEQLAERQEFSIPSPLPFPETAIDFGEIEPEERWSAPSTEKPAWLVEVTQSEDDGIEAHFVHSSAVAFGSIRPEWGDGAKEDADQRWYYDYASAPPQMVSQPGTIAQPMIRPLKIDVRFDRLEYAAEELVEAEIRITDEDNTPRPAVLGVRVELVPLEESESFQTKRDALALTDVDGLGSSAVSTLPLVFDNGQEQKRRYEEAWAVWQADQDGKRRWLASALLWGSGFGAGMLLLAVLGNCLPRVGVTIPVATTLSLALTLGLVLMRADPVQDTKIARTVPLTNFGIHSQPPAAGETESSQTGIEFDLLALDGTRTFLVDQYELALPGLQKSISDKAGEVLASSSAGSRGSDGETLLPINFWQEQASARVASTGKMPTRIGDSPLESVQTAGFRTVLWNPVLTTDEAGVAMVRFHMPDKPLCSRLVITAHSQNSWGSACIAIPAVCGTAEQ